MQAVKKTFSGLMKLVYPDENITKEEAREILEYALVGRRRVKEQLKVIGGNEFKDVNFYYTDVGSRRKHFVHVPESIRSNKMKKLPTIKNLTGVLKWVH